MRKCVCMISLAMPIEQDVRTLRQAEFLAPQYDITLIGYGNPSSLPQNVTWKPTQRSTNRLRRLCEMTLLTIGRVVPVAYDIYLSSRPHYRQTIQYAAASQADVYHACDWAALALCAQAAKIHAAPIFFDADEFWPLENETSRPWQLFFSPLIAYTLHSYASKIDAATTVSRPIADRYKKEYNFDSIILLNAPDYEEIPLRPVQPDKIRLMHHGAARRNRYLETMIKALAASDARYTLHLMMVEGDMGYLDELKQLAEKLVPGRVEFRPIVHPFEIVRTIADCDIGICLIPPTTYTYQMTLPNKLFEFMIAGMAVINGPSPAMAEIVCQYESGWVLPDFTTEALAELLNSLTLEQIEAARAKAREAAQILNAQKEFPKLLALYHKLLRTG